MCSERTTENNVEKKTSVGDVTGEIGQIHGDILWRKTNVCVPGVGDGRLNLTYSKQEAKPQVTLEISPGVPNKSPSLLETATGAKA
jgi:hypothetical protein